MQIQLRKPHCHAGTTYRIGDTLEIDALTARWLIEQGIAEAERKPTSRTPPSVSLEHKETES